jgi:hypothetical protein
LRHELQKARINDSENCIMCEVGRDCVMLPIGMHTHRSLRHTHTHTHIASMRRKLIFLRHRQMQVRPKCVNKIKQSIVACGIQLCVAHRKPFGSSMSPLSLLVTCFTLVSYLAYSSTLLTEVICFFETYLTVLYPRCEPKILQIKEEFRVELLNPTFLMTKFIVLPGPVQA